eukprot:CAMPEP_0173425474 /NCGR_PEP_ID=MMETSP1357-20121228/5181_1 /TAXON_ID=77926 /ORGANISM="Hemiselmis rufescens, Strain PCC563" /LENGTH=307 /DNA_ID=CAMNT_0014388925 /DNA_START=27 /DNA_END=953 /DNA_ORIENTATION=+
MTHKTLQVPGHKWSFDFHSEGSGFLDCFRVPKGSRVFEAVGPVVGKLTLKAPISGSVKARIQKKSQDKAQQKRDRAATKHDPIAAPAASKKRKSSSSAFDAAAKSVGKQPLSITVEAMSEVEKRQALLHHLALQDLNKEQLRSRLKGADPTTSILKELATWHPQKGVYSLHKQRYKEVDPDYAGYDGEQRTKVRQRKAAIEKVVVQIASESDARRERERYVQKHQEYVSIDQDIQSIEKEFERLGAMLTDESGKRSGSVEGKIRQQFESQRERLVRKHGEFMRLHAQLRSIREQLVKWGAESSADKS